MAQFNSLTDRVRQMLGGIVQQAPKTLSDIGNVALDAVNPNIRPAMKSAQILKQNVQAIPRLMPQFQQNARANPIPMKAFEGLAEATTLGMKDIKYRPSQNLGEKLAYGTGYTLGMLNPASPLGLTAKAIGKLPAVSQGIANVTSKFAPTIAQGGLKALGARGIVNAAQGLPYTAAYSALRTAGGKGNIADAPADLAFDFGVGALPLVGGLAVASSKPLKGKLKQFFINSADLGGDYSFKEVKGKIVDIFDGIDTFVYKNKAGEWIVTEGRTGSQISRPQSTISKAIEDAKISMKLATERAGTTIQDQISKVEKTRGISPAYKQVTTQDFAGYKRVPTPEELRAKMAQDAQRATKAGTQATGGMDAVWNNDPTLKARIDDAFSKGDTATVQKLLPQVPEQYKTNYAMKSVDPLLSEAKKYKSAEEFVLPKEISTYEEAKMVGAKRIAPDRTPHQQLTPEEGIRALINKQRSRTESNAKSWETAALKIKNLASKYGDTIPMRTEKNIQKYPGLVDDYRTYYDLKQYAIKPKGLSDMATQFEIRANGTRQRIAPETETKMYESAKKEYIDLIKTDISKGYKFPEEVLNYDKSFKTAVDSRARYEKGLATSFSADDSRIVFDDQNRIVAGMKRQDGMELLPTQKQEIIDGVLQTQKALGIDLNKLSKDERWVYAHLNGKNPFLTKNAAGMYRRAGDSASVSLGGSESFDAIINGEKVRQRVNTTAAHEIGHALDGNIKGKLLDSSLVWDLKRLFKPVVNSSRGDKYWSSQSEITARAIEQYVAVKEGHTGLFDREGYWSKDVFESKIKPAVEKSIDTNFSQYKTKSQLTDVWNKANTAPVGKVANTSQPKTPRTIKVVDQSRTQQPISSPVSGNVGTEAKASVGQTSQPILETAPLNKSIPQRGFAESVQTNKKTPAEIKPELEKIRYEPISNAETMAQADKIIQTDELKALDFAKNNADTTANSVSLKLIEKYLDQGRFSEANDLISAVAPRFTKAGQEIQILSTYGRLTPTGAIKYAQTLINQANKANPRLNLKLTEANTKIITEYANRVQSLPVGSRERIVATAQLMQKITDQVPPSIGQKIATIQTMMQLLNPKTAVRNIIGNTLFTGAENISDVLATGLDRVTGFITGRRSKVLPSITAQGRGFIKGGREGFQDAMLGIDTSGGVSSQFEIKGKTFTDPILGSLEKALNIELRVPDRAAYTAAFEGSLNNQMRAAGITKATPEMIEIAHADGLYRTFQDNSRLAQIFSGIKKTLNKIGTPDGRFGLGDFVLKYPKTPANILSRGLDYSPAGFVKGIYEGIRPFMTGQPFNQKQFVENLSRAMVGTGLISAGYILAKNGIISGKNDKDYDISSVKRTTGQGAFKLNASALSRFFQSGGQKQDDQNGDVLVSYDWAQPTSIQVAMGANSALGGNAEDMASIASDNLQAGVDTLTGQSMVKNLMDYAGGIKDKGFVGATQDMALNSATGFIPSVVRQTANVFDPLQRSTYAGTPAGVAINKAKATIPFVRNTLEPKLDVFGKEMPNYEGSGLQRLFDIFVNPAFVTKIQENPAAKEVIDIYQRSGLTTQAPRVADSKIKINGQDVKVSPQQYTQYQRYMGTKTDETFNALMNDPLFRKSSDEDKAKLLQGILTDINSAAKIELFGNNPKSIPQDVKTIMKTTNNATDRMLTLTKEGNLKMAMGDIEYPKLTGNTELDKKLITAYRGKITQKANEITAMYEAGEITAAQAETELNKLIELKSKVSTKKAKKAPKITVRKLSAPKVAKSARIKIKIPKLKKPKTLKLKKYTVKLSK